MIGIIVNLSRRWIIPNTAMEISPPIFFKVLFMIITRILPAECLVKAEIPIAKISFKIGRSILRSFKLNRIELFFKIVL